MIEISVDTIRDLGAPAIAGSVVGALIAHFSAKARGREEHNRTLDLIVTQDERRAALGVLEAAREISISINAGAVTSYPQLHNEWSDRVLAPARVIRSEGLKARAAVAGYVIFLATVTHADEDASYVVLRGVLDVEEWAESWLRREPAPPAYLPSMEEIQSLVRSEPGTISLEPLYDRLQERLSAATAE